jgi:hypothetical protein
MKLLKPFLIYIKADVFYLTTKCFLVLIADFELRYRLLLMLVYLTIFEFNPPRELFRIAYKTTP